MQVGRGNCNQLNITAQMLKAEEFKSIEARTVILGRFNIKIYNINSFIVLYEEEVHYVS